VLAAEYPEGVDIVYEGVGGAVRAAIMPHLAPGARLLQVGYISGAACFGRPALVCVSKRHLCCVSKHTAPPGTWGTAAAGRVHLRCDTRHKG
jgi:NADPH-dependent curcumin reductase CurA